MSSLSVARSEAPWRTAPHLDQFALQTHPPQVKAQDTNKQGSAGGGDVRERGADYRVGLEGGVVQRARLETVSSTNQTMLIGCFFVPERELGS